MSSRRFDDMSRNDHGGGLLTRWDAERGEHVFLTEADLQAWRDAWWERIGKHWGEPADHPPEGPLEDRPHP